MKSRRFFPGDRTRPRVLISAPSPKSIFREDAREKVRDAEGVMASTRGRVRSPES